MRFCDERTRPSVDLVNRIKVANPQNVIDLGCGPGNSTQILRKRWPDARIVGLNSSAEMIETARSEMPAIEWTLSNIEDWQPEAPPMTLCSQMLPFNGYLNTPCSWSLCSPTSPWEEPSHSRFLAQNSPRSVYSSTRSPRQGKGLPRWQISIVSITTIEKLLKGVD